MAAPNTAAVAAVSPNTAGGLFAGPKGTALPTSETTTLNAALKALGYLSDDGLNPSGDAPSLTALFAWGGDNVANVVASRGTRKFSFTLISVFDPDVAGYAFGSSNVTTTAAVAGTSGTKLAIQDKLYIAPLQVHVVDGKYAGKKVRLVMPLGQSILTAEEPFQDSALTAYTFEVTAQPDSSGVSVYRYLANDDF